MHRSVLYSWFSFLLVFLGHTAQALEPIKFSRDVQPLLSDNCLSCHGQDEKHRKADLRLDTREGALSAIKPGKPEESELIKRIVTQEEDDLMPPPKSHKARMSVAQVSLIRRWIKEGAVWGKHWSFEKPVQVKLSNPSLHPVDALVSNSLKKEGLTLAKAAPKHTLIRRLSFDLTGLPPTPAEVSDFEQDTSPDAYRKVVKRLLASPHFGERMAMWWLDAARYSDTDGYQSDATRTNWPWRDYVVESFNSNKPFDQFTLEQFAGDLLPKATAEQKIATCFHRNHMTNGEGGRDKEESRIDYVIDRVNTMGTVWLGLTLGCTQCHSHKFDPITQADYYGLSAFFNSIDEDGAAGKAAKPYLSYQSPLAKRALTEAQALVDQRKPLEAKARSAAEAPFSAWLEVQSNGLKSDYAAWRVMRGRLESQEGSVLTQAADGTVEASGANPVQDDYRLIGTTALPRVTGFKLEVQPRGGKLSRGKTGEFILTDIKVQILTQGSSQVRELKVATALADYSADKKANNNYGDVKDTLDDDPRNGWTTKGKDMAKPHTAVFAFAQPYEPAANEQILIELRHRSTMGDANIARFKLSLTDQPGSAVRSLETAPMELLAALKSKPNVQPDAKLRERLFEQFLEDHPPYQIAKASLDRATAQLKEATAASGKLDVMVLAERKQPRETNILVRGVWDKKGDVVKQDVPAAIFPWPKDSPRSRIGLAQWITSKDNPLTARVIVNHLWQMCFGAGLVRTPEDFGLQGQRPTHPELLDWLAVDFMEHGWDIKHLLTRMVTSATYQQDSAASADLITRDPQNRLLARGPRFRLPSWMLRDSALRNAGLINPALGGPPVRPYQPDGVWEEIFMGRFTYEPSEGAAQYRRTLYAFWRRSIAPTFLFDSAQRRVCEVGVSRTNTPLQALTLLNDLTMMEASKTLATQMLQQAPDEAARLSFLYAHVLSRQPKEQEVTVLKRELSNALAHYRAHPEDAASYLSAPAQSATLSDLAAYTVVASLVLNLDEAITHE